MNDFQRLERLIGVKLPAALEKASVKLYADQPDPAYPPHTFYARVDADEQAYADLVQALGLTPVADSDLRMLLPGKWQTPQVLHLDWWTPALDTPPNAAGKPFGEKDANGDQAGWILAQFHDGYAYLRIYLGSG
jgi:hypothetical protein